MPSLLGGEVPEPPRACGRAGSGQEEGAKGSEREMGMKEAWEKGGDG